MGRPRGAGILHAGLPALGQAVAEHTRLHPEDGRRERHIGAGGARPLLPGAGHARRSAGHSVSGRSHARRPADRAPGGRSIPRRPHADPLCRAPRARARRLLPAAGLRRRLTGEQPTVRRLTAVVLWTGLASVAHAGEPVWDALRTPGSVVVLRHSFAPGGFDPPDARLDDCSTQRNLDESGRAQARRLGEAFQHNGIVVGAVLSSPRCRCLDTARLAFGRVEAWSVLQGALRDEGLRGRQLVEINYGGGTPSSTALQQAKQRADIAVTAALVPLCVAQSKADRGAAQKLAALRAITSSYEQHDFFNETATTEIYALSLPDALLL